MKVASFDKAKTVIVAKEATAALQAVAEKYGLSVSYHGARYSATNANMKFEFATIGENGAVQTSGVSEFEVYAKSYGLLPTDLGRSFTSSGHRFKIEGLNVRCRRYPVKVTRDDGKRFKYPVETVVRGLKEEV